MLSYVDTIPLLLQNKVRVLVYNGDADYVSHWYGASAWVTNMDWSGQPLFLEAPVTEWFIDGQCKYPSTLMISPIMLSRYRKPSPPSLSEISDKNIPSNKGICGWYQSAQGLTFVRIREAGHLLSMDQPLVVLTLINSFMHKTPLTVYGYLSAYAYN